MLHESRIKYVYLIHDAVFTIYIWSSSARYDPAATGSNRAQNTVLDADCGGLNSAELIVRIVVFKWPPDHLTSESKFADVVRATYHFWQVARKASMGHISNTPFALSI